MNPFKTQFAVTLMAFAFLMPRSLGAGSAFEIRLVKISPVDQTAVVRLRNNDLRVIRAGDRLDEKRLVKDVSEGRVVLETSGARGLELVIIRVQNGKQHIEKILRTGQETPVLYFPSSGENVRPQRN
jgi:hypothetical protein